ncbi:two-component system sensor histidine kinase EnvZ, partial [Erwinia amylovora]|nr:two-component system sensor histidine kinase EnvZ [Erwinia amylovora]
VAAESGYHRELQHAVLPGQQQLDINPLATTRALDNKPHNAARYGKGWNTVSFGCERPLVWFQVVYDGPVLEPDQFLHLFQPFVRG